MILTTSLKGADFASRSSTVRRIWFTKKIMKKNKKDTRKYRNKSLSRYLIKTWFFSSVRFKANASKRTGNGQRITFGKSI